MSQNISLNHLRLLTYDITFDKIDLYPRSKDLIDISTKVRLLIDSDLKEAAKLLQIALTKYPDDPTLNVYLANIHMLNEDTVAAKSFIIKNYQRFPDYFFARYTYIEMYIDEDNFEEAAKAFDNKFDLKMLYPNRSVFHISELLGFCKISAKYFYGIGKNEQAELYVNILKKIDDKHPIIKDLKNYKLYCTTSNFIKNIFGKKSKN